MAFYLGIDVGTQSVKTLIFDATSRSVAAVASSPLELISRGDGSREQLAEWWLAALRHGLSQIEPQLLRAVAAIAVSGQQHGFVPMAEDGSVLAPVKLWCDTATEPECEAIMAAFGGRELCIRELGNPILPGYTASKIRWLKNHRPECYAQLSTILLPHDYLNFYLTGERVMECGDASGTGLLDIRARTWHPAMVAALDPDRDLSHCLPRLVAAGDFIGKVQPQVATALGLPVGIPVSCGGGDNMMAAIGTGNVKTGRLTVSLGTSGTLFAYSDTPVIDSNGEIAAFCDATGGWLPLLCTMNCTVATELTRNALQIPLSELDERVSRIPAGCDGVVTLPFFQGERTPNLPAGQGCILGLNSDNYSPNHLLRSAMESALFGLFSGVEALRRQGCTFADIRLTGGGAKSAVWRQMVADIFNLPVTVQVCDEGAALGAALQGLWVHRRSQGEMQPLADLVDDMLTLDHSRSTVPEPSAVAAYQQYFQRYQTHLAAISPLYS